MRRNLLTIRSALLFALAISILMHLFFFIMMLFGREAIMPPDAPQRFHHKMEFSRIAISMVSTFIYTFILFIINFRLLKSNSGKNIYLAVGVTILVTFLLSYIFTNIELDIFAPGANRVRAIRGGFFRDFFISILVFFSSQLMYLSHRKQQIILENETLQAENIKSRYAALKNQIDPHFLFNTLNTLNSIIKIDPDKAQEYVQKLSSVFRYTLQNREIIPLEKELNFTKDYCNLMQIRYGDSLAFHFSIDKKYLSYEMVPLSIQTLVENAIKHNVITARRPLNIYISTQDNDTLSVTNVLQEKKEKETGEGIGLSNLAERYRLKWNKDIEISSDQKSFQVVIPLIKPTPETYESFDY